MKRVFLATITFYFLFTSGYGQSKADNGLWGTISFEKQFSKKFSFQVDEEVRLKDNISRLDLLYSNVGFSYSFLKGFKSGIYYRLTEKYTNDNDYKFKHRFMFDLSYKYRISSISFSYRSRVQTSIKDLNSYCSTKHAWYWRNKFEVKYSFKRFSPYLGVEFYYLISNAWKEDINKGWYKWKPFIGLDYKLNSRKEFGFYYQLRRGIDADDSSDINVIGLRYKYTLPYEKK